MYNGSFDISININLIENWRICVLPFRLGEPLTRRPVIVHDRKAVPGENDSEGTFEELVLAKK